MKEGAVLIFKLEHLIDMHYKRTQKRWLQNKTQCFLQKWMIYTEEQSVDGQPKGYLWV
jgi:hypothetical protein